MQTTEGSQTEEKVSGGTQTGSQNGQDGMTQTQEEEQDSAHLLCRRVSSRFRFSICANSGEAARAASIIQATYRGHKTRRASMLADGSHEKVIDSDINRRQSMPCDMKSRASISGQDSEKELNNIEFKQHDSSMSNIHEADPEKAATTIQAAFRGHVTRQSVAAGSHPSLIKVEPQEGAVLEEESSECVVEEPQEETEEAPSTADPEE